MNLDRISIYGIEKNRHGMEMIVKLNEAVAKQQNAKTLRQCTTMP